MRPYLLGNVDKHLAGGYLDAVTRGVDCFVDLNFGCRRMWDSVTVQGIGRRTLHRWLTISAVVKVVMLRLLRQR